MTNMDTDTDRRAWTETDEGVTRWRRVADRIRAAIADGSLGERLAPETELAEQFAVNRHTVRRAIQSLAAEGLLRAERGHGMFVNTPAPRVPIRSARAPAFSENDVVTGRTPSGRLIRSEPARADATVEALRELSNGSAVAQAGNAACGDRRSALGHHLRSTPSISQRPPTAWFSSARPWMSTARTGPCKPCARASTPIEPSWCCIPSVCFGSAEA